VSTRHNVGLQPQASILAAICNKAGVDLDKSAVYKITLTERETRKWKAFKSGNPQGKAALFTL